MQILYPKFLQLLPFVHAAMFLLSDRYNQVSRVTLVKVGCGLSWVYERAAGKFFFFSACHFRGIRDDIEEEDEQVSEPSKVLHHYTVDQRGLQTKHSLIYPL